MIRIEPKQKRDLFKISQFGILWAIGGILYSIIEYGILGDSKIYPSTGNIYQFETSIISAFLSSVFIGLLIGIFETKLTTAYFKTRRFWQKLVFKTTLYLSIITVLLLFSLIILFSIRLKVPIFDSKAVLSIKHFISDFSFWSILIYAGILTVLILFITEVSNYLGGGVLTNFFIGKYHHPKEEERIFMFLDMNSSTAIAEELGHLKYFSLLKTYYKDLTEAIIQTGGEVYQYAGDEIIVSWDLEKGLYSNSCIDCFFRIKTIFKTTSNEYLKNFSLVPEFKAGFHYGKVTTGEIGVLRKEIFFTGDVLNTTSRIQTSCRKFETDILISKKLIQLLNLNKHYNISPIGECKLKGRNEAIELFTIS